jgi:hydrogenase 3 maturation protease
MYKKINREDELVEILEKFILPKKTAIIGLGNELRCDDAFGVMVANALQKILPPHIGNCVKIVTASTNPEAFLDVFDSYENIIVLDTLAPSLNNKGLMATELDPEFMEEYRLTTHSVSLGKLISGKKTLLIGINASCLDYEIKISLQTAKAMSMVIRSVYKVLLSMCNLNE